MATRTHDPHVSAHLEWLGFVRPTGLVVSAPALVKAGVILNRRDTEGPQQLRACVKERGIAPAPDFRAFAEAVLGWRFSPRGYAGGGGPHDPPIPPELDAPLPESGDILRPDVAVRTVLAPTTPAAPAAPSAAGRDAADAAPEASGAGGAPGDAGARWQLLVSVCHPDDDFDRAAPASAGRRQGLDVSPHGRMERLLRHTGVSAGLLVNGGALRLMAAPRGESSGWLDFRVADMLLPAGRPIVTAMRALLGQPRLLTLPRGQRLAALIDNSRKYQNEVSERLADQVLHALYELLRGFQAAHDASRGVLLARPLADDPDQIYRGLLTVVLRLVFLLYAEERDLLPQDETFLRAYSIAGLYERLREDAARYPDTMEQRYGAWAQLLALWRMVHDGARSGSMHLPPRHGALFDPDRDRFLEGRGHDPAGARQIHLRIEPPRVSDGTVYRVLQKLIVLDGERISYRALDVEHIGSVYETMMGFRLETASGRSVAIKAAQKRGAPATIDLEALLREPPAGRAAWFKKRTDRTLTDRVQPAVQHADTVEALHAALDAAIDHQATPDLVRAGALVLHPSEARRRSGSHYTPRALTGPIVRRALEPVLAGLRSDPAAPPHPDQILGLNVCDPAMGSGAFLVEACRQLADALIEAWRAHDARPARPADETEVVFARRLVAQRCLYGVDRNPKAVDLAKLSLWLVTLARDHPLTFLDHALRHGDSLVGLSRRQIEAFHWKGDASRFQPGFETLRVRECLAQAAAMRRRIQEADDTVSDEEKRAWHEDSRFATDAVRRCGDLVVAAFFEHAKPKAREAERARFADAVQRGETERYRSWLTELRTAERPLAPFHWEIEFPEVFEGASAEGASAVQPARPAPENGPKGTPPWKCCKLFRRNRFERLRRPNMRLRCHRRQPAVSWRHAHQYRARR